VKTHFMQKQTQHTQNFEYDIVRGKGNYSAFAFYATGCRLS